MKELVVKTGNPKALDDTLRQLGGFVEQRPNGSYVKSLEGTVVVRSISGNIDYLKFAITNQGYGKIIKERDIT